ncbi:MAG: hypothetical protein HC769_29685 [Cyanobacteria bacterium CRU_2_1]|nr:hypothetical protein [Cyanobacteria bacterium RU_5_0]NJR62605.1 hypothetical protein [Cyanobacteria bacterium CRU_2_1]
MLQTIQGIYQNGQIELTEQPQDVSDRAQVLVTFLDSNKINSTQLRQLIDQLETIAGIQQGFDELNAGQTRPIQGFVQDMQHRYGISS